VGILGEAVSGCRYTVGVHCSDPRQWSGKQSGENGSNHVQLLVIHPRSVYESGDKALTRKLNHILFPVQMHREAAVWITMSNWDAVLRLKVGEEAQDSVSPSLF
jgi:hypothetical protein